MARRHRAFEYLLREARPFLARRHGEEPADEIAPGESLRPA